MNFSELLIKCENILRNMPFLLNFVEFLFIFFFFFSTKTMISKFIIRILKFFNYQESPILLAVKERLPKMVVYIGVVIATERLLICGVVGVIASHVAQSLVVIIFFNTVLTLVPVIVKTFLAFETVAMDWLVKLVKGFVFFVSISTVLQIWSIHIGPIIAGFGLLGAAVAFAAKDLFENIISGAILIAENKFKKGDHIKIDNDLEGIVDSIKLRSTKLIRFDRVPVFVPNAKLAGNSVYNFSMRDCREVYMEVGVTYDTSIETLKSIVNDIKAYIKSAPDFVVDNYNRTSVHVSEFGDSSINILIICFSKEISWIEWQTAKEKLMYQLILIVKKYGSSFAFPSQSIYLSDTSSDLNKNMNMK